MGCRPLAAVPGYRPPQLAKLCMRSGAASHWEQPHFYAFDQYRFFGVLRAGLVGEFEPGHDAGGDEVEIFQP